jgi:hypothetical protein
MAVEFYLDEIQPRGLSALVCETWTPEENKANMTTLRLDEDTVLVELSVGSGTQRDIGKDPRKLRAFAIGDYSRAVCWGSVVVSCIPWERATDYKVGLVAAMTLNDPEGTLAASYQRNGRLVLW